MLSIDWGRPMSCEGRLFSVAAAIALASALVPIGNASADNTKRANPKGTPDPVQGTVSPSAHPPDPVHPDFSHSEYPRRLDVPDLPSHLEYVPDSKRPGIKD